MSDDITPATFIPPAGHPAFGPHTAREALDATLRYPGESWLPVRAEAVCAALFGVLMHSQQERALEALGWRKVPPPAPSAIKPDPARDPRQEEFRAALRDLADCATLKLHGGALDTATAAYALRQLAGGLGCVPDLVAGLWADGAVSSPLPPAPEPGDADGGT